MALLSKKTCWVCDGLRTCQIIIASVNESNVLKYIYIYIIIPVNSWWPSKLAGTVASQNPLSGLWLVDALWAYLLGLPLHPLQNALSRSPAPSPNFPETAQEKKRRAKSKNRRHKCRQWFSDGYLLYKDHCDHKFRTRTCISIPPPCCYSYPQHIEWWQVAGQFFVVLLRQHPLLFPLLRQSESLQSIYCTHAWKVYPIFVYQRLKRDQMDTTLATTSHAAFRQN